MTGGNTTGNWYTGRNAVSLPSDIPLMMKKNITVACIALALSACAFSAKKKAEAISALELSISESARKNIADTTKVKELLADYDYYIAHYPKDSLTPVYLMRSADFDRAIGLPEVAIANYHRVYMEYPQYPKANMALFLEGFTNENDAHDLDKARSSYQLYLQKYPDSKMARDVKFLLDHLGMTPEQIMHEVDSVRKSRTAVHTDTAATAVR